MKVGSKVICVGTSKDWGKPKIGKLPHVGRVLTVRGVVNNPIWGMLLYFDEYVLPMSVNGTEAAHEAKYFREIDTTPELSETTVEQLIEELELTPQTA